MIMLRFARPEDAPALLEIYRPYVEHTTVSFETQVPTEDEFRSRIAEYTQLFPYLVAEEANEILGYAYAHAFHERAAYSWTVETSIYVREDLRKKGVGKRLYGSLLPILKAQGVVNVCAVVTIPNDPSMAFHEHFGFRSGNLLPDFGFKNGQWLGVAYLYLRLAPHADSPAPIIPVSGIPGEILGQLLK